LNSETNFQLLYESPGKKKCLIGKSEASRWQWQIHKSRTLSRITCEVYLLLKFIIHKLFLRVSSALQERSSFQHRWT
jgi:hypothetical protein